jgi:hypothetical protein
MKLYSFNSSRIMLHAMEAGRRAQRCKNEAEKLDYEETK